MNKNAIVMLPKKGNSFPLLYVSYSSDGTETRTELPGETVSRFDQEEEAIEFAELMHCEILDQRGLQSK